jgi:hypothetical protein
MFTSCNQQVAAAHGANFFWHSTCHTVMVPMETAATKIAAMAAAVSISKQ